MKQGAPGGLTQTAELKTRHTLSLGTLIGSNYQVYEPRSDMRNPSVAYNPDLNEYLAVYTDDNLGTSNGTPQVYAQLMRGDGSIKLRWGVAFNGSRFAVSPDASVGQYYPKVAYNAVSKRYLVSWVQTTNPGSPQFSNYYDVCARLFDGNGVQQGGTFAVANQTDALGAPAAQTTMDLAASTRDGQFLVSWVDGRAGANTYDVYARCLGGTTSITPVGSELLLTSSSVSYPYSNSVVKGAMATAYNSDDNNFMVAWFDNVGTTPKTMAQCVEVTAASVLQYVGTSISTNGYTDGYGGDHSFDLAYRPANSTADGRYLLVDGVRYSDKIQGKLLSRTGAHLTDVALQTTVTGKQIDPVITYNGTDDEFFVVWGDGRRQATESDYGDMYGRAVLPSGAVQPEVEIAGVDTGAKYNQYCPTIAYNSTDGEYLSMWNDYRGADPELSAVAGTTRSIVFAQRFHSDATLVGSNYQVYEPRSDMRNPSVAYNPDLNEYLAVYTDDNLGTSNGTPQVYAQLMRGDGSIKLRWGVAFNGSRFAVSPDASVGQYYPKVAYNAVSKRYLVSWVQTTNPGSPQFSNYYDVCARLFDGNGVQQGGTFAVANQTDALGAPAAQTTMDLAASTRDGQFLVSWVDGRAGANTYDVYARCLGGTTSITPVGSELLLTSSSVSYPYSNSVVKGAMATAYNSDDNNFMVAWFDNVGTTPKTMAQCVEVTAASVLQYVGTSISTNGYTDGYGGDHSFDLAYRPANSTADGRYLLVDGVRYSDKIQGKLLSRTGAHLTDVALQTTVTGKQIDPVITYNGTDDEFFVVWGDGRRQATESDYGDMYGRAVLPSGAVQPEVEIAGVDTGAKYNQYCPTIAYNSTDGEYLSMWNDYRGADPELSAVAGTTRSIVFAQRFK